MPTIKFLGASGTVTGSCYLITSDSGTQILIDCGMFQGSRNLNMLNYRPLSLDIFKLSAVVLTHAHLDHTGRLPILVRQGYAGPIFATEATIDLANLVLLDTAKIANENRSRDPLYSETDAEYTIQLMKPVEYHKEFFVKDFKFILRDAGHIMGSSIVELYLGGKKAVFSGDLGNSPEDLVRPTEIIDSADTVVMEATYGDRIHSHQNIREILANEILQIENSQGTLLIPSFSIERTQELLHVFDHLKHDNQIAQETPVYLDSPMAIKATEVYKKYRNLYSHELQIHTASDDPFDFPNLKLVSYVSESRKIWDTLGAKVIVAGSGMLNGGRMVKHLQKYISIPSTRLLFVGFQAHDSLGSRLLNLPRTVKIKGIDYKVLASINKCSSLSAHADQPKLIGWSKEIKNATKIFLVHAEDTSRKKLSSLLPYTILPQLYDVRDLF